ncbi:MAG: class II aldolase/adducin family protein, partial [Anaerolineae bacterium]
MTTSDALRAARQALVDVGLRLLSAGLVQDGQGNLSLRLPDGRILITPSAVPYRQREAEDICVLSPRGEFLAGRWKPTSELPLHLAFYQAREDVGAVIHTHAPYATVFGVTGEGELPMLLTEAAMHLGGAVSVAPYARPGTELLARRACESAGAGRAVILAHHG